MSKALGCPESSMHSDCTAAGTGRHMTPSHPPSHLHPGGNCHGIQLGGVWRIPGPLSINGGRQRLNLLPRLSRGVAGGRHSCLLRKQRAQNLLLQVTHR